MHHQLVYNLNIAEVHTYTVGENDGAAVVHNSSCPIRGYTSHGLNQAIGRNDGRGVNIAAMHHAVRYPKKVVTQSGGRVKYIGQRATVVLNSKGQVITVHGKARSPKPVARRSARPRYLH